VTDYVDARYKHEDGTNLVVCDGLLFVSAARRYVDMTLIASFNRMYVKRSCGIVKKSRHSKYDLNPAVQQITCPLRSL